MRRQIKKNHFLYDNYNNKLKWGSGMKQEIYQKFMDDALVAKAQGRYEDALNNMVELLEAGIVQADILYQIADIYFLMEDYQRAAVWGNKAVEVDAAFLKAYWLTAMAYAKQEDMKAVLKTLEAGLSKGKLGEYRDIFASLLLKNDVLRQFKEFVLVKCPLVFKEFSKVQKTKQQKSDAKQKSASSTADRADNTDVSASLEGLLRELKMTRQHNSELQQRLLTSYEQGHLTPEDLTYYQALSSEEILREVRGIEENVVKQTVLNILAVGFFAGADYEKALQLLIEAATLGDDEQTFKNLAAVLCELGETQLAVSYLQKVGGKDIMALNLLGQIKANVAELA